MRNVLIVFLSLQLFIAFVPVFFLFSRPPPFPLDFKSLLNLDSFAVAAAVEDDVDDLKRSWMRRIWS